MDLIDIGEWSRCRCCCRCRFLKGLVMGSSTIKEPSVRSSPSDSPSDSESVTGSMTGISEYLMDLVSGDPTVELVGTERASACDLERCDSASPLVVLGVFVSVAFDGSDPRRLSEA